MYPYSLALLSLSFGCCFPVRFELNYIQQFIRLMVVRLRRSCPELIQPLVAAGFFLFPVIIALDLVCIHRSLGLFKPSLSYPEKWCTIVLMLVGFLFQGVLLAEPDLVRALIRTLRTREQGN